MADNEQTDTTVTGPDDVPAMNDLDRKVTGEFSGYTVRKDLVGKVKGNALVPSYVLEYLLGKYVTTTDWESVRAGVERVRAILADNYVHREEANLIQSKIREKGRYQVIDKVQVTLNEKLDQYEATFENLGISRVVVDSATVKKNPKLLVTGIWCMCTLVYAYSGDPKDVPWRLHRLMPVQMSHDDRENYLAMRSRFTAGEWVDLLMQSVGFEPALFFERAKLLHLVRMIPFVERNYNLIELGPKGTGKSHIYSEFSPHGMLISGGEVTAAKLFVNNSSGQIGLVGYWDTVAFDEFAGKTKKADRALVDIMKNYMANKSFSRGRNTMQAEASMAFIGNTSHNVPYMLKNTDLFEELPKQYHDPAFLDRIHYYVPGWEFEQIRSEMFTSGYGFVVDYLAEILHNLRDVDYASKYEKYFALSPTLSTRDKDGVRKTFSGLMKLIYPSGEATMEEMEPLLRCAIEGRKRVKDQLCRIDSTMTEVDFSYTRAGSPDPIAVHTVEEDDYPDLYWRGRSVSAGSVGNDAVKQPAPPVPAAGSSSGSGSSQPTKPSEPAKPMESAKPALSRIERAAAAAKAGHLDFSEGRSGVSYNRLFGAYVAGAKRITLQDPYIRYSYQARNLAEFLETVYDYTNRADEVQVHLIVGQADDQLIDQQIDNLDQLKTTFGPMGIILTYEFSTTAHDRFIVTDTGWRISLGRGLDIYQRYDDKNWLNPQLRRQNLRQIKEFSVDYRHVGE
ncbi:BREX system Lon protease-like protein BrxL [Bifidobacterium platyrrhinorum]|uniref:BREX system Lon protease-like protein BrxL n=1 Tax=Bifidobacterium platyrrhinorum TaxID=2661628 RepID=A0A6L9SQG3_9BIFI|nr:BREX system Lon protease-like protein BrxL [Bifidobacterium platyrrhinorum]NEG54806.1 BREX system Lon protease-like protein BrxL [Bifidobacterium platyrrhinorum]